MFDDDENAIVQRTILYLTVLRASKTNIFSTPTPHTYCERVKKKLEIEIYTSFFPLPKENKHFDSSKTGKLSN